MFHAPTTESKQQNDSTRSQSATERTRELSPRVPAAMGPASAGAAAGAAAPAGGQGGQPLAHLHSAYGNQAVLRMLSCAPTSIQTKLTVNQPGDQYEQEADRVADQVMRMAAPAQNASLSLADPGVQRACACGGDAAGECAECKQKREGELQRVADGTTSSREAPPIVHEVLRGRGQPLDPATRSLMEFRFGHNFGQVRIHADQQAAHSARAVAASAYTVGNDIVFASGRYAPTTTSGRHLLAHELAHTIQQTGGSAIEHGPSASAKISAASHAAPMVARQNDPDAGTADTGASGAGPSDAGLPGGVETPAPNAPPPPQQPRKCGPDITSALSTMLGTVPGYFSGLSGWQKRRSCAALDIDAPFLLVNPIMAWDTRQLFLPNTGWLDSYFRSSGCGSPRDPGCDADPTRHLCETSGSCGNTVIVGGKCMLAGTANYALYGKMFKLCNDQFSPDYPRWDMRAMITAYKTLDGDDPAPPLAMATAVFDGGFPTIPSDAENRGSCTDRCGVTHGGSFDFIWEPYRSR